MASSKDQETIQLSAKDCLFLKSILHQLLSNGAKVDWAAVAKECDYKTGPSAYMCFSRIKKKMGWPSEGANQETAAAGGKPGAKRRGPTKKEKSEHDEEIKREGGEDDGPSKKRQKRNPIKKEEDVDGEDIAHAQGEGFVKGAYI